MTENQASCQHGERKDIQLGCFLLRLYPHQRSLLIQSHEHELIVHLTPTETKLLGALFQGTIIPYRTLYAHSSINNKDSLETHIRNLRSKLYGFALVSRVTGYGYALLDISSEQDAISA